MAFDMRLYRRKDSPNYYVEIERGKSVSLKTGDKEVAETIFREMEKESLRVKLHILDESERVTVKKWSEIYRSQREHLSADTTRMDELSLRLLAESVGEGRAVKAITKKDINEFVSSCLAKKVKPVSINSYLRHIKAALNEAVEAGYMKKIPKFKFLKTPKRLPKYIMPEHINLILHYTKKTDFEMWRIIQFALWTGVRRKEVLGLTWQNVSDGQAIVIGKGDKERAVDLMPAAVEAMGESKDVGPVFHQFHKDTISHRFNLYAKACKVKAHFHMLRHSCAIYMLKSGISLAVIQDILGHADLRTTQIYAQVVDSMRQEQMKLLKFE